MPFSVHTIRNDFPTYVHNNGEVYLDTAATSLTPRAVIDTVRAHYEHDRANIHRRLYRAAQGATDAYERTRSDVAQFIGAHVEEVVFTAGATASANMLVYMLEQNGVCNAGDEIVTSVIEHHATLLPLSEWSRRKHLTIKKAGITPEHLLDIEQMCAHITERTRVVSIPLASNVLGSIHNITRVVQRAHGVGAFVVVDATAGVGHMPVRAHELDVDFMFFSGHKMCSPTGVGVLYGKKQHLETFTPSFFGGGIVDDVQDDVAQWSASPHRFEAGTPNIAGVIGMGAAVQYLERVGVEAIHTHVRSLTQYAQNVLGDVEGVTLYSAPYTHNVGIISFTVEDVHPHDVAQVCADAGVAVRAGHHCVLPLHHHLGVTATVRASMYLYNTERDIDTLAQCIQRTRDIFT